LKALPLGPGKVRLRGAGAGACPAVIAAFAPLSI